MIKPELIHQIQRLLATGKLSRRNIAQRLGVARGTVSAVAAGKFRLASLLCEPPQPEPPSDLADRETRRCPTCRAMVRMPCRLCRIRRLAAGQRIPPLDPPPEGPIGLDLMPIHQARYAQIRRWRRQGIWLGITHSPAPPVLKSPHMNRKHRPQPESKPSPPEPRIPQLHQVVVHCTDETDQRDLYQRLTAENRTCRLIIL